MLDVIGLAERILQLLDRGSFTTTYKYAVLLALIDTCVETAVDSGAPFPSVTTRQLAEKVFELYWRQADAYPAAGAMLTQHLHPKQEAGILAAASAFRGEASAHGGSTSLFRAKLALPDVYRRHIDDVEWTLIRYPLPLLQNVGREQQSFLYTYSWEHPAKRSDVRAMQKGAPTTFDNMLRLQPGVGEGLVQLSGLLRTLIQKEWTSAVAGFNRLETDALESFLFAGADRTSLQKVRAPLVDVQKGQCFYCGKGMRTDVHVDHFIPWSRHASNALGNLVAAHEKCNLAKSDYLAAERHLEHWLQRDDDMLESIAADAGWEFAPQRTGAVVRNTYLRLPSETLLWERGKEFVRKDTQRLLSFFS